MKRIVLGLILMLCAACADAIKNPEFKNADNIRVLSINQSEVRVATDLHFFNPNVIGGTISKIDLNVFVDETEVAKVNSEAFEFSGDSDFTTTIMTKIPHKELFGSNAKQLLGSIINSALNKKAKVAYKGQITFSFGDFEYNYDLDETLDLDLKK